MNIQIIPLKNLGQHRKFNNVIILQNFMQNWKSQKIYKLIYHISTSETKFIKIASNSIFALILNLTFHFPIHLPNPVYSPATHIPPPSPFPIRQIPFRNTIIFYSWLMLRRYSSSLKKSQPIPAGPSHPSQPSACSVCDIGLCSYHLLTTSRVVSRKYSASQNFFYTRDIVDLLDSTATKVSILTRDLRMYDGQEEHLGAYCCGRTGKNSLRELAEYFKYYKDIPRVYMRPINNIYRRHHQLKRVVEYNRLKAVLNLTQDEVNNADKQKPVTKTDAILTGLSSLRSTYGSNTNQPNLSQSLINLREKLAKLIKQSSGEVEDLAKIDQQYSFGNARIRQPAPPCNISFQGISEIISSKSQSTLPIKLDMKKHSKPRILLATPIKTNEQRKRFSMENIRSIRLRSQRSTDRKNKRRSQQVRETSNPKWKTPTTPTTLAKLKYTKPKPKNTNTHLMSTDTSDVKLRILEKRDKMKKGNSEKLLRPKHSRVSSEQIELRKAVMETPKRDKLKITINQNNIFNIVIDNKTRDLLRSCKSIKKFKK